MRDRFRRYFRYSLNEIDQLAREHGVHIPPPSHLVFGHTHQPIPRGAGELVDRIDGRDVRFCNTGGWLLKDDGPEGTEFAGAEVVVYETGRGFASHSVRDVDLVVAEGARECVPA